MNSAILFSFCILLSACAAMSKVELQMTENTACIKGGMANFIRHFTSGEVHVGVNPQRKSGAGAYGEHCIPAGKQTILVSAARGPGFGVNVLVTISLKGGHRYVVRSVYAANQYHFSVIDVTDKNEKIVYDFNVSEGFYGKNVFSGDAAAPIDLTLPVQ